MIMPVNTPMVSDEYTSLVMSARASAKIGGTMERQARGNEFEPFHDLPSSRGRGHDTRERATPARSVRECAMRAPRALSMRAPLRCATKYG